jgi:hypothetical protein
VEDRGGLRGKMGAGFGSDLYFVMVTARCLVAPADVARIPAHTGHMAGLAKDSGSKRSCPRPF